ncbi:MAG: DUF4416 family protein [Candidatus Woesearchaeota archaeon]
MSVPKEKPKANLVISIMFSKFLLNSEKYRLLIETLNRNFGNIILEDGFFDFDFTNFYEKEFGKNLIKKYICFDFFGSFGIEKLPKLKLMCYDIEKSFLINDKRLFNVDVGYVKSNAVVFASFKERAHRIYLSKGVYADLQLVYENNDWKEFKWTFSDIIYKKNFFSKLRIMIK